MCHGFYVQVMCFQLLMWFSSVESDKHKPVLEKKEEVEAEDVLLIWMRNQSIVGSEGSHNAFYFLSFLSPLCLSSFSDSLHMPTRGLLAAPKLYHPDSWWSQRDTPLVKWLILNNHCRGDGYSVCTYSYVNSGVGEVEERSILSKYTEWVPLL